MHNNEITPNERDSTEHIAMHF